MRSDGAYAALRAGDRREPFDFNDSLYIIKLSNEINLTSLNIIPVLPH